MRRFEWIWLRRVRGECSAGPPQRVGLRHDGRRVAVEGTLDQGRLANLEIHLTVETCGQTDSVFCSKWRRFDFRWRRRPVYSRRATLGSSVVVNAFPNRRGNGTVLGMDIMTSDGIFIHFAAAAAVVHRRDRAREGARATGRRASGVAADEHRARVAFSDKARAAVAEIMSGRTRANRGRTRYRCGWWRCSRCCGPSTCARTCVVMKIDSDGSDERARSNLDLAEHLLNVSLTVRAFDRPMGAATRS